jgi:hypothetical protein
VAQSEGIVRQAVRLILRLDRDASWQQTTAAAKRDLTRFDREVQSLSRRLLGAGAVLTTLTSAATAFRNAFTEALREGKSGADLMDASVRSLETTIRNLPMGIGPVADMLSRLWDIGAGGSGLTFEEEQSRRAEAMRRTIEQATQLQQLQRALSADLMTDEQRRRQAFDDQAGRFLSGFDVEAARSAGQPRVESAEEAMIAKLVPGVALVRKAFQKSDEEIEAARRSSEAQAQREVERIEEARQQLRDQFDARERRMAEAAAQQLADASAKAIEDAERQTQRIRGQAHEARLRAEGRTHEAELAQLQRQREERIGEVERTARALIDADPASGGQINRAALAQAAAVDREIAAREEAVRMEMQRSADEAASIIQRGEMKIAEMQAEADERRLRAAGRAREADVAELERTTATKIMLIEEEARRIAAASPAVADAVLYQAQRQAEILRAAMREQLEALGRDQFTTPSRVSAAEIGRGQAFAGQSTVGGGVEQRLERQVRQTERMTQQLVRVESSNERIARALESLTAGTL